MDAFDYEKKNIHMLRDDASVESKKPSRQNIINELNKIVENEETDEIWIHFSGHGTYKYDDNNDENDYFDEIIIPIDYEENGIIKDEEMLDIIKKSKCKTIITFDCCNSGSICDLPWRFEYVNNGFLKYKENNNELENKNIIMFSSCRDYQLAVDGWSDNARLSYGAMTEALVECLRYNRYNVKALKLLRDVSIYMNQRNQEQITTLSSSSEEANIEISRPLIHNKNDEIYDISKDTFFKH